MSTNTQLTSLLIRLGFDPAYVALKLNNEAPGEKGSPAGPAGGSALGAIHAGGVPPATPPSAPDNSALTAEVIELRQRLAEMQAAAAGVEDTTLVDGWISKGSILPTARDTTLSMLRAARTADATSKATGDKSLHGMVVKNFDSLPVQPKIAGVAGFSNSKGTNDEPVTDEEIKQVLAGSTYGHSYQGAK